MKKLLLSTLMLLSLSCSSAYSQVVNAQVNVPGYGIYTCMGFQTMACFGPTSVTHPQLIVDFDLFLTPVDRGRQSYLYQAGNNNNVTIEQIGGRDSLAIWYGEGSNNTGNIYQWANTLDINMIHVALYGNNNTLNVNQIGTGNQPYNAIGVELIVRNDNNWVQINQSGSRGNALTVDLSGGGKSATINQTSTLAAHYATLVMTGGPGNASITQTGNTSQNVNMLVQCFIQPCSASIVQNGP